MVRRTSLFDVTKAEKVGILLLWIMICAALSMPIAYSIIGNASFVGGGENENFSYVWMSLITAFFGILFGSYGIFKLIVYRFKKTRTPKEIGYILAFVVFIIFLASLGISILWDVLTSPESYSQSTGTDVSFDWFSVKTLVKLSLIVSLAISFIIIGIKKIRN